MTDLWIDAPTATDKIKLIGQSPEKIQTAEAMRSLVDNGFAILKNVVPPKICDAVNAFNERVWIENPFGIKSEWNGQVVVADAGQRMTKKKVLDTYVFDLAARAALFQRPILDILESVFQGPAKVFQSLAIDRGTEQAAHQDPAYVVLNQPKQLLAAWIALEDVVPGSGELEYYPGSHRTPDFLFGSPDEGHRLHWNSDRDGHEIHNHYLHWVHSVSSQMGLKMERFYPKKGDVLIWHAKLIHGGSKVENAGLTRKSLVGHYCPLETKPNYFDQISRIFRDARTGAHFSTGHYDGLSFADAELF
ncbi:MAG: phytanoyl-CoA dioxygenase family protein [Bdellovibrionales bacterium]|nr:phytanoyl-CoA dioxygenase family protein [Bdellovibrionales bacterium]